MQRADASNQVDQSNIMTVSFTDAVDLLIHAVRESSHSTTLKLIDINHHILAHEEFVQTLKNRCIESPAYHCNILAEKLRPNSRTAEFIRYYQRLTDKIKIKRYVPPQTEPDRRQFIIIDSGLVAWQSHSRNTDMRLIRAGYRIKQYQDDFTSLFAASERDIGLMKLYI